MKNRIVNTKFWDDDFIISLDPIEKLLFLYCLTNTLTTLCGIYEITLRRISFDTGIDRDMITNIMKRFEKAQKIKYDGKWMAIKNFMEHQSFNANMQISVNRELEQCPVALVKWVKGSIPNPSESFRRVSNPSLPPIIYNNIKSNIDKDKTKGFKPPTIEMVKEYIKEKGYDINADKWWNFYEAKGWMIGKNKMKKWHRAIVTWLPDGWKAEKEKKVTGKKKMDEWTEKNKEKYNL